MERGLKRFTGKDAFVTGAGSGIGKGISLRLAKEGANIAVCDIDEEKAKETAAKIEELGQRGLAIVCDVAKEEEIEKATKSAFDSFEKIDVLVNNAGTGDAGKSFKDIDSELWDRIYSTNVKGPFFLTKMVAMDMIKKKIKGKIINIASVEGKNIRAGSITYASSKSALIGLTQGLAMQLAPHEINVNAVCPGLIDTPMWHKGDKMMGLPLGSLIKKTVDTAIEQRLLKIPRAGTADDIASAVAYLASEDAGYITGQAINVCGGMEFR